MQQHLRERLRRHPVLEAQGGLGRWQEAHLLVIADPHPLVRLARLFRQSALVQVSRGQPARLVLVSG